MSFSSELKQELSKINNLSNKEQVKYELIGYLLTNHVIVQNRNIRYATESEYNINRFSKLLSNLQINHKIEVEGNLFVIILKLKEINLDKKAKNLVDLIKENPFQNPPPYEKLVGDLQGFYSRRLNIKHRLVYQVNEEKKTVRIISLWSHYESI